MDALPFPWTPVGANRTPPIHYSVSSLKDQNKRIAIAPPSRLLACYRPLRQEMALVPASANGAPEPIC
jgi:hypothetical protein